MQTRLTKLLLQEGAAIVGFADLGSLPAEGRRGMNYAVSIAVALDPQIIQNISEGPTHEYEHEYKKVNTLLAELSRRAARLLADNGYQTVRIEPTSEDFDTNTLATSMPHKTIATRAGLGWIGKSALLITEQLGAAFRMASVLTDAAFETPAPVNLSRCGECRDCVKACPGQAILDRNWEAGMSRESYYNAARCHQIGKGYTAALRIDSTICGICIAACPWTKKYISRSTRCKS
jgi:epoxyqueuosine reductase